MPTGQDASYSGQSKIYVKQQPAGTTINGNTVITEEVTDTGGLQNRFGLNAVNNVLTADQIAFTIAQGGSTGVCLVTITVTDNAGQPLANQPFDLDVILSDAATGVGVTATAPSVSATITTGTTLNTYVTNKAYYAQTNASGQIVLTISDASKTHYFVMVQGCSLPFAYVSRQLQTADYHP